MLEADSRLRLDLFLSRPDAAGTRSQAARLIKERHVTVNGRHEKASYQVVAGDVVAVSTPAPQTTEKLRPRPLDLDVVFEDDAVLIINKPAGLVVHPATSHIQDTLVNALLAYTPKLSAGSHPDRPGIVHRLDKDTSGLLVVAKTDPAHASLARQFKEKTIHRIYWAVVFGTPKEPDGTITSYLARHPKNRKKFASCEDGPTGKKAVTHYELLQSRHGLSLLRLRLETGRTHQIRVHLSEKGFPIVGDRLYGARGREKNLKSMALRQIVLAMSRFALHAAELGFDHPTDGRPLRFNRPWPLDLLKLIQACEFAVSPTKEND